MAKQFSPLRLPVRTESGQQLGHVVDIEIDPETHAVLAYHVKVNRLMPDLVSTPLIIAPTQIVSLNEREMIVDDAASGQRSPAPQPFSP